MRILLRDFRTVVKQGRIVNFNIGTTAHGPGAAALLERLLPDCEICVWASAPLSEPLNRMMQRRFPKVRIVSGRLDGSSHDVEEAVRWCDFLLIGPGTRISVAGDVDDFIRFCGKPYGAAGIGFAHADMEQLRKGEFTFFRETSSLEEARRAGLDTPTGFVPDGAFAFDAADDAGAADFMERHRLEAGKFVCCLPRYRHTPRWEFCPDANTDAGLIARNRSMLAQDMAPLVQAACDVVREMHLKVLLSPETEPATRLCQNELLAMFPDDIRPYIAVPDAFWEADLALGVYRQSRGLFGTEMHSQVMAVGNGIPAIVCRTSEFGTKSQMWNDIGLGEWLFDFDSAIDRAIFPAEALRMLTQREHAARLLRQAHKTIWDRFAFFADFLNKLIQ